MSKITNNGLTWSSTGCFIAVPIWQQWASKGRAADDAEVWWCQRCYKSFSQHFCHFVNYLGFHVSSPTVWNSIFHLTVDSVNSQYFCPCLLKSRDSRPTVYIRYDTALCHWHCSANHMFQRHRLACKLHFWPPWASRHEAGKQSDIYAW